VANEKMLERLQNELELKTYNCTKLQETNDRLDKQLKLTIEEQQQF
jgi:hypothetical protein